jgi:hypothetical protein
MHASVFVYAVVTTGAHHYYGITGTALDSRLTVAAFRDFQENRAIMAGETPWLTYVVVLTYIVLGPAILAAFARRSQPVPSSDRARGLAFCGVGLVLGVLSFIAPAKSLGKTFSRDPLVHFIVTAVDLWRSEEEFVEAVESSHPVEGGRVRVARIPVDLTS